jgi:hypothetical protein
MRRGRRSAHGVVLQGGLIASFQPFPTDRVDPCVLKMKMHNCIATFLLRSLIAGLVEEWISCESFPPRLGAQGVYGCAGAGAGNGPKGNLGTSDEHASVDPWVTREPFVPDRKVMINAL